MGVGCVGNRGLGRPNQHTPPNPDIAMSLAVNLNAVRQAPVRLVKPNGLATPYGYGASTDVARGTALASAVSAAAAFDKIELGPGKFDLGTSQITLPDDAILTGSGRNTTWIISGATLTATGCIVVPGSRSITRNLRIVPDIDDGATFQAAWGSRFDQTFTEAVIEDCDIVGATDGLFIDHTSPCSAIVRNCRVDTNYDCVRGIDTSTASSSTFDIYGGVFRAIGPFAEQTQRAIAAGRNCTVNVYGATVHAAGDRVTDPDGYGYALYTDHSTAVLNAYDCNLTSSATGSGDAYDAYASSGAINLYSGSYDPAKLNGVTNRKPRVFGFVAVPFDTNTSTGDGKVAVTVPPSHAGMVVTKVYASVQTAGTTNTTDVMIRRDRGGTVVDMLSAATEIASGATNNGGTASINASNDDLAAGDILLVDIDAVSSTAAKGLQITLEGY